METFSSHTISPLDEFEFRKPPHAQVKDQGYILCPDQICTLYISRRTVQLKTIKKNMFDNIRINPENLIIQFIWTRLAKSDPELVIMILFLGRNVI